MHRLPLLLLIASLALGAAACGSDDGQQPAAATPAAGADACAPDQLALTTAGTLTVGTDKPAYPPYFEDDDPANGKGFESAVAYAVADQLGLAADKVKWTVVPFNSSYAPGPKKFDFDINQISISPKRAERVDFSTPYYTAPQAVVALKSSPAASATSLSELADDKLGVQVGTTSLDAVSELIKPTSQPQVFNDSNDTVRALKAKRVDAIVVDLPTAFYLTAAEVPEASITGQFDAPGGDDWGLVLAKDSELTPCVDRAIEKLKSSGELQKITDKWMGGQAGAPELR
ncbi:MAG TPA: ABC transporter substrate-binding protein [Solirubrobacteraceae bacterium]|nr:ABC transporter substrate-binding protein [Solirubrobacteraceae bacterium]